jgi:hypothetical protein
VRSPRIAGRVGELGALLLVRRVDRVSDVRGQRGVGFKGNVFVVLLHVASKGDDRSGEGQAKE